MVDVRNVDLNLGLALLYTIFIMAEVDIFLENKIDSLSN
jgi:hypothetical protein